MFSKKLALTAALVFGALLFCLGWVIKARRYDNIWESIICLYLLSFLSLFYFISNINTIKKSLAYCVLIPLLFCALACMPYILQVNDITGFFIVMLSPVLIYSIVGWQASISLMIVFCFHLYLQRSNKQSSEKNILLCLPPFRERLISPSLFKFNKCIIFTGIAYIAFILLYKHFYENFGWGERGGGGGKIVDIAPISLLSLFSVFYLVPILSSSIKRLMFYCILFPIFWSVIVRIIYAILVYVYAYAVSMEYFEVKWRFTAPPLSVGFYFDYYTRTRAWLISLLLVFLCIIYYSFSKDKTAKKTQ